MLTVHKKQVIRKVKLTLCLPASVCSLHQVQETTVRVPPPPPPRIVKLEKRKGITGHPESFKVRVEGQMSRLSFNTSVLLELSYLLQLLDRRVRQQSWFECNVSRVAPELGAADIAPGLCGGVNMVHLSLLIEQNGCNTCSELPRTTL